VLCLTLFYALKALEVARELCEPAAVALSGALGLLYEHAHHGHLAKGGTGGRERKREHA